MLNGKLSSIQYLRALAALTVVVAHAWDHPSPVTGAIPARLGEFGVVLFFVISGYIMVAITGEGRFSATDFLKRRAIRIVPLYWIATTLAAALALMVPALFKTTVFTWPHYLLSLLFVPHAAPGTGSFSPLIALGWTLNYEVWFYLCFAALSGFRSRARATVLTAGFALLTALGAVWHPGSAVAAFYTNYDPLAFCLGCWIGHASISGTLVKMRPRADLAAAVVVVGGLVAAFAIGMDAQPDWPNFIGLALAASGLVVLSLRHERKLVQSRALLMVGDASYALYLIHMFVVGAVVAVAGRFVPLTSVAALSAIVGVSLMLAVTVAILAHRFVEVPILRRLHAAFVPRTPAPRPALG